MMKRPLSKAYIYIRDAIRRHGGGWQGLCRVALRSLRVLRALGWNGFLRRLQASRQAAQKLEAVETRVFPPAVPIEQVQLRIGVMAHVYYPDLLEEFARDFARLPLPYTLMVSVVDEAAQLAATERLRDLPNLEALHVRIVPNRGRDIAPMLLSFREEILALDLFCHVHTKKSLYTGQEQTPWRRYLLDGLLGSRERIGWILGMFGAEPSLGMVYPESYRSVPLWAHTWLGNAEWARQLGPLLGIAVDTGAYLDYPAGSMFWARTEALRPLFELDLDLQAFPPERGQADGTLQHALERLLGLVVRKQDMLLGILPADGRLELSVEGERNRNTYFNMPVSARLDYAAIEAELISFDLFDTLLLRPFLEPAGSRTYLSYLVEKRFGLSQFAALRADVEASERARLGRDVSCAEIYRAMGRKPGLSPSLAEQLRSFELSFERQQLRPRPAMVEALRRLIQAGHKRIIGVSDMYMDTAELRQTMPDTVSGLVEQLYISCETGWRKDTGEAWQRLPELEQVAPRHWLHVGDNEHADVQLPQALGFIHPVHVLRPSALLSVVPALRSLRPRQAQRERWQDQLWLGLIANRFAELGDRHPEALAHSLQLDSPETFGYVVLGPLLTDYLSWLARLALSQGSRALLFLSREGYVLHRAYAILQSFVPELKPVKGIYLLASRRGVGTPSIRRPDDLLKIFNSPYTGPLDVLLEARLGSRAATAAMQMLEPVAASEEVYLPEMAQRLVEWLHPAMPAILEIAEEERSAYLAYWKEQQIDAAEAPIVADIGYAGTIQARLTQITGQKLGGAYFAIKRKEARGDSTGWTSARFHDADTQASSPVMEHHLLLESILTSPDGQFSHFEHSESKGLQAIFREAAASQTNWPLLERIHAGAERFVRDICTVAGDDALELELDPILVQEPLRCVGSGRWRLATWGATLQVEDHYTGRGEVPTLSHPVR